MKDGERITAHCAVCGEWLNGREPFVVGVKDGALGCFHVACAPEPEPAVDTFKRPEAANRQQSRAGRTHSQTDGGTGLPGEAVGGD